MSAIEVKDRRVGLALGGAAALIAVGWPLSAYAINPIVLPAGLMVVGALFLILSRPEYGIALALTFSPLINATATYEHTTLKPFQFLVPMLAAGILVYASILRPAGRAGPESRWLAIGVTLLLTAALLASSQALQAQDSINKMFLILTAVAVSFAVRRVCVERHQIAVVVAGALAGLAIASMEGIVQSLLGVGEAGFISGTDVITRVQGSFGHPNQYGGYIAFMLPVAAVVLSRPAFSRAVRALAAFALLVGVPALYLSYARGAEIGVVGGAAIWLVVLRPRYIFGVGAAIVLLVLAVLVVPGPLRDRFQNDTSGDDLTLRQDIWNASLQIYAEHPLLGVGVNNFSVAYERLPSTTSSAAQRRLLHQSQVLIPPHPESMYLQALAEQGLVGLAALAVFLAISLVVNYRAARVPDPIASTLGIGIGAGLIAVMIHGVLDVPLTTEAMPVIFGMLSAVGVATELQRHTTARAAAAVTQPAPAPS